MEGRAWAREWSSSLTELMAHCFSDVLTNCLICYFQQPQNMVPLALTWPPLVLMWSTTSFSWEQSKTFTQHFCPAGARLQGAWSHGMCSAAGSPFPLPLMPWQPCGSNRIRHISGKASLGRRYLYMGRSGLRTSSPLTNTCWLPFMVCRIHAQGMHDCTPRLDGSWEED